MHRTSRSSLAVLAGSIVLWSAAARAAQSPPAIPGTTGTIALDGTVEKTYEGANKIIVAAEDGVEHLFHAGKQTEVHGAESALNGVAAGMHVVVHYTVEGGENTAVEVDRIGGGGLREVRGVVTSVDRDAKRMSIRLADGTTETLQLTDRAAKDVGADVDAAATVVVYYADGDGRKVAHYFAKIHAG